MKKRPSLKDVRLKTKDKRFKRERACSGLCSSGLRPHRPVTRQQMQALDYLAIAKIGVPSLALMENAGAQVAREVRKTVRGKKGPRVCIVCGLGNNAGDGLVAARHLLNAGAKVSIFFIGEFEKLKNDPKVNCEILMRAGYPVNAMPQMTAVLKQAIKTADIVVDALFGVGLSRPVEDPFKSIIVFLNQSRKPIVSIDVPSGLDATTGEVYGVAVKATKTVTLSLPKQGFYRGEGPRFTGKVVTVDIGIPEKLQAAFLKETQMGALSRRNH